MKHSFEIQNIKTTRIINTATCYEEIMEIGQMMMFCFFITRTELPVTTQKHNEYRKGIATKLPELTKKGKAVTLILKVSHIES